MLSVYKYTTHTFYPLSLINALHVVFLLHYINIFCFFKKNKNDVFYSPPHQFKRSSLSLQKSPPTGCRPLSASGSQQEKSGRSSRT
jgi:hypothetical protein